jgi:hypothetical protein
MNKTNPTSGTGVYYPPCTDVLYAYHAVHARGGSDRATASAEGIFRNIWKQGALLSSRARAEIFPDQPSMFHARDVLAGDDQYVFCSLCKPHGGAGSEGYNFVFDAHTLIQHGAVIGLDDLASLYSSIGRVLGLENIIYTDDLWNASDAEKEAFRDLANFVQQHWRIRGRTAELWYEWIRGRRAHSPISAAALRWTNREIQGYLRNIIRWVTEDRASALNMAELLFPNVLPLDLCVGVTFRKDWYTIEDFIAYYGLPGKGEPPEVVAHALVPRVSDRRGHPIRCPRCGGWVGALPGEVPVRSYFYDPVHPGRVKTPGDKYGRYVWVCQSCGAAFSSEDDEYVGQYDELEKPSGW